jgi:hypothetical protein
MSNWRRQVTKDAEFSVKKDTKQSSVLLLRLVSFYKVSCMYLSDQIFLVILVPYN